MVLYILSLCNVAVSPMWFVWCTKAPKWQDHFDTPMQNITMLIFCIGWCTPEWQELLHVQPSKHDMIAAGSPVERWGGDAGRGRGRGPPGPTPPRWGAPGPERHQHPDRWGGPIAPETRPREARDKWEKWGGFEGKPLGANSYCGSAIAGLMRVAQVA